jgi:hypothetical protein
VDVPSALTAKFGPLPAWAWGLIVGAGVLGYGYLRHRSSSAADATAADAAAGDAGGTAADATDLSSLDSTAPLDFAGPVSGTSGVGGNVPTSLRIDPAQWARLQRELAALKKAEHRDHQRSPKHKHHKAHPHVAARTVKQPSRQRPRVTGQPVSSGSGPGAAR